MANSNSFMLETLFPRDIWSNIYSFDCTYKDQHKKVLLSLPKLYSVPSGKYIVSTTHNFLALYGYVTLNTFNFKIQTYEVLIDSSNLPPGFMLDLTSFANQQKEE